MKIFPPVNPELGEKKGEKAKRGKKEEGKGEKGGKRRKRKKGKGKKNGRKEREKLSREPAF